MASNAPNSDKHGIDKSITSDFDAISDTDLSDSEEIRVDFDSRQDGGAGDTGVVKAAASTSTGEGSPKGPKSPRSPPDGRKAPPASPAHPSTHVLPATQPVYQVPAYVVPLASNLSPLAPAYTPQDPGRHLAAITRPSTSKTPSTPPTSPRRTPPKKRASPRRTPPKERTPPCYYGRGPGRPRKKQHSAQGQKRETDPDWPVPSGLRVARKTPVGSPKAGSTSPRGSPNAQQACGSGGPGNRRDAKNPPVHKKSWDFPKRPPPEVENLQQKIHHIQRTTAASNRSLDQIRRLVEQEHRARRDEAEHAVRQQKANERRQRQLEADKLRELRRERERERELQRVEEEKIRQATDRLRSVTEFRKDWARSHAQAGVDQRAFGTTSGVSFFNEQLQRINAQGTAETRQQQRLSEQVLGIAANNPDFEVTASNAEYLDPVVQALTLPRRRLPVHPLFKIEEQFLGNIGPNEQVIQTSKNQILSAFSILLSQLAQEYAVQTIGYLQKHQ